jgi:YidC/Oxa1 family membrane protein insertase
MAQQQKVLLYVLPLIFAFSGVNFPIGVLLYWTTTNLWSMGQQFYTIRRMPTPGSEAERRLKERRARKGKGLPEEPASGTTTTIEPATPKGQRQQPVGKARAKAKAVAPTRPAAPGKPAAGKPAAGTTPGGSPKAPSGTKPVSGTKPGQGGKPSGGRPGAARSTATPRASGSTAAGAGDGRGGGSTGAAPTDRPTRKRTGDGGDASPSPSQPTN